MNVKPSGLRTRSEFLTSTLESCGTGIVLRCEGMSVVGWKERDIGGDPPQPGKEFYSRVSTELCKCAFTRSIVHFFLAGIVLGSL